MFTNKKKVLDGMTFILANRKETKKTLLKCTRYDIIKGKLRNITFEKLTKRNVKISHTSSLEIYVRCTIDVTYYLFTRLFLNIKYKILHSKVKKTI